MKKKEKLAVIKDILQKLGKDGNNFKINSNTNDVAFITPIGDCYRGFCINALRKDEFRVEIFFVPLYIPQTIEFVAFNIGWTLGEWTTSSSTDEIAYLLKKDALSLLIKAGNIDELLAITMGKVKIRGYYSLHCEYAVAAKAGNIAVAQQAYAELKELDLPSSWLAPDSHFQKTWVNVEIIHENLLNREALLKHFDERKKELIKSLNLEPFV
jgi:hypothetical protein